MPRSTSLSFIACLAFMACGESEPRQDGIVHPTKSSKTDKVK